VERFDPYYEILGIRPEEQPPNHYRLLGIAAFETNQQVIAHAAARQMRYLRTLGGDYGSIAQQLLNEVAEAKLCLWDPEQRAVYNRQLKVCGDGYPPTRVARVDDLDGRRLVEIAEPAMPVTVVDNPTDGTVETARLDLGYSEAKPELLMTTLAHESNASPVLQAWLIGSSAECDIVIERDVISRKHCRLEKSSLGTFLVDLGSTNGTYVNEIRIQNRVRVLRRDRITLGRKIPFPWPEDV
jgi:hypothetical protein